MRLGGVRGLAAIFVYAALVAAPLPDRVAVFFAAAFGPLFSLVSYGLYRTLSLQGKSAALQVAAAANAIAGALVTAMLLVQLAVVSGGHAPVDPFLWTKLRRVDLGLDVAWDVYGSAGTFLYAWKMLRHPRFGRIFGAIGLLLGGGLAVLNLATFPAPPNTAGLVDLGPLIGLWYAAVSVQLLRSRGWAEAQLAVNAGDGDRLERVSLAT